MLANDPGATMSEAGITVQNVNDPSGLNLEPNTPFEGLFALAHRHLITQSRFLL